jgi:uncharacterized protein YqjF (DUF2071 family)
MPALPWLSAFPELNVRTYVTPMTAPGEPNGKPGVWFFSLDAANPVAVAAARASYHLHYFRARMSLAREGGMVRYSSVRTHRGAPGARFEADYRPTGPVFTSRPRTLEHWLTDRYCLYSATPKGRLYRADIHHAPWPLQPAECVVRTNTMTAQCNLVLPDSPPLLHFAKRLDVVAWLPERVG